MKQNIDYNISKKDISWNYNIFRLLCISEAVFASLPNEQLDRFQIQCVFLASATIPSVSRSPLS